MKRNIIVLLLFLSAMALFAQARKQKKEKRVEKRAMLAEKVAGLVETQNYTFIARSVNPIGWSTVMLNSEYDLKVIGDSVIAYLPFFGRAYRVDYSSNEGGIKFNTIMKNYTVKKRLTRFIVNFEAQTEGEFYGVSLLVTRLGYCSLTITSNNRQVINYSGIIDGIGL